MSSERIHKMGAHWQNMTPEELHEALSKTDPDQSAHEESSLDVQKRIKSFDSVTSLIEKRRNPVERHPYLNLFAERFEDHVRALSMPQLLEKLSELEKKAFHNEDADAFYELKNYLKAVERIGFEDPLQIEKYDRPAMHRLAILCSDDMTPALRNRIFKAERENLSLEEFMGLGVSEDIDFLKSYDGRIFLFDHPHLKTNRVYGSYLLSRWSKEEIAAASQKGTVKHREAYNAVLNLYSKRNTLRQISKMSVEELIRGIQNIHLLMSSHAWPPSGRIELTHQFYALTIELASRGQSLDQLNHQMIDLLLENYKKSFGPFLPEGVIERLRQPTLASGDAFLTPLRLDNYKIRHDFMEGVRYSLQTVLNEKGSNLREVQNDHSFDNFISTYGSLAKNANIPFDGFDLMEIAAVTFGTSGLSITPSLGDEARVVGLPMGWEELLNRGNVTLSWQNYPRSEDWLEDEVSVMRQIHYNGVSIYDLAQPVLDTVTLSQYSREENAYGGHAIGTARALFKHIDLEYTDAGGNIIPFHERLQILSHEIFHNLQGAKALNGIITASGSSPLLAERDAYLFGAYVLEEYLKLRLAHSHKKPISQREIDTIAGLIAGNRLSGRVSNFWIAKMDRNFNANNMSVELPMTVHSNLDFTMNALLQRGTSIGEIFSLYPASHDAVLLFSEKSKRSREKPDETFNRLLEEEKEGVKERIGSLFDPKIPLEPDN